MSLTERVQHLNEVRRELALTVSQLWLEYIALGGNYTSTEFEQLLEGGFEPKPNEFNVLTQALNEHFLDSTPAYPLAYEPAPDT